MIIEFKETDLNQVKGISNNPYVSVYKMPCKINGYEYISEEYDDFTGKHICILGYLNDDYFDPQMYFIPMFKDDIYDNSVYLDLDNWKNEYYN